MAQTVKCLPAMWETRVRFLGREDPLEKEMATLSNILAWRIPWAEEPGGYSLWDHKESDSVEQLSLSLSLFTHRLLSSHCSSFFFLLQPPARLC